MMHNEKSSFPSGEDSPQKTIRTRKGSFFLGVLFTVFVGVVFCLGLYAFNLLWYRELSVFSNRIDLKRIMQSDPETFWSLKPNLQNEEFLPQSAGPQKSFRVSTNAMGLRNPPIEEKRDRFRILAIGDSTTFGQYVEDQEAWPAQLQTLLDPKAQRIEVINAGLIGATAFQGLCYLMKEGFSLSPDIVIATYGFNDRGDWSISDRTSLPSLMLNPIRSAISRFTPSNVESGQDRIDRYRVSPGEYLDVMITMAEMCQQRKIALYLLLWPSPSQLTGAWDDLMRKYNYQSLIFEASYRSEAKVIDLREAFHNAPQPVLLDIVHASPAGCRLTAECIAAELRKQYPSILISPTNSVSP